jgi:hypothetical protein
MRRVALLLAVLPLTFLLVGFHTPPTDVAEENLYRTGSTCLKRVQADYRALGTARTLTAYRRAAVNMTRHSAACQRTIAGVATSTPEGEQAKELMVKAFRQGELAGKAFTAAADAQQAGNESRVQRMTRKASQHLVNKDRLLTQADELLHAN